MSFCLFYIQQACLKQIENQKRRRLAMQCTGVPVVVPLVVHLCITSSVVHQLFSSLLREFLFCATVFRPCSWRGKSATHQQFCCESPQRYNVNEKKKFRVFSKCNNIEKSIEKSSVFITTFPFARWRYIFLVFNRVSFHNHTVGQNGQKRSHFSDFGMILFCTTLWFELS